MAAVRQSPIAIRQWLVRLGHLCFDDFLLLDPRDLASSFILHPSSLADWSLALNNAPNLFLHFRRSINLQSAICNLQSDGARPCLSTSSIASAQARLVTAFAFELLRAKAPPLYDALPWQDWDFSIVTKRFRLWQTRFLLAGDGTTVTMCRCRKSAGVYVLEPCETIARYIERKAALERIRHFRLVRPKPQAPSPKPLSEIPLPDNSVDLAVIGSCPELETGNWKLVTDELLRVAANVLVVECSPLAPPLDQSWLAAQGFVSETVEVRGLGPRPCHWKLSQGVGRSHGQNL